MKRKDLNNLFNSRYKNRIERKFSLKITEKLHNDFNFG